MGLGSWYSTGVAGRRRRGGDRVTTLTGARPDPGDEVADLPAPSPPTAWARG